MKPVPRRAVLGPFAALEPAFLAAVRAARRAAGPLAPIPVLVPSNLLRAHLLQQLADTGGAINVRFLLVPDLARAIAPGARELPPLLDDLLVEAILETPETARGPFAEARARPGLRAALLEVFRDLLEARIAPGDFAAAVRDTPWKAGAARRLHEVARLFSAYRQALSAAGVVETSDVVEQAIARADRSELLRQAPALAVYGFYDFTAAQLALVGAIAAVTPTTVFFPWVEGPAFAYARPALEALRALGFHDEPASSPPAPVPPDAGGDPGGTSRGALQSSPGGDPAPRAEPSCVEPPSAELETLRRRLFRPPSGDAAAAEGAIAIVSCPGEAREAREIARRLSALARHAPGLAFERVAVLPRRLEPYRRRLRSALHAHGVPAAVTRQLGELREARTLLALLALRRSGLGRRELMDLLEVAELPVEIAARGSVASWDRLSREAGVLAGRKDWQERLEVLARRAERAAEPSARARHEAAAARQLSGFVLTLDRGLETLPLKARPSLHAGAAAELLKRFASAGEGRDAVLAALAALAPLDAAGRELTLERFAQLCETALQAAATPPAGTRPLVRGVLVHDLMSARGVPFDVVVVPGLVERGFPAPAREEPVLLDEERASIGRRLRRPEALRAKAARSDEERLLFALATGSARKRLVLTYPRLETGTARERVPSSFLLAVAEALSGERADYGRLEDFDRLERVPLARLHPDLPEAAESDLEYDLALAALEDPREVLSLAELSPFFRRGLALDQERWSSALSRFDGVLAASPGRLEGPLSVTRLETYAKCPLRYFFRDVLGLSHSEEPERVAELEPMDRGSIIHAILHDFFSGLRAAGGTPGATPREPLRRALAAAARAEFARHESAGVVGPAFLWELEQAAILADLGRWLDREIEDEREGGWMPALFEARFGPPGSEPIEGGASREDPASRDQPVVFDLGDGRSVAFRGRIDRIDRTFDRRRFRVIDYKTGRVHGERNDSIRGGRALQLPVYLRAGRELLPGPSPAEGEAAYDFVTRRGGFRRFVFSEKGGQRKGAEVARAVRLIADGIDAGRFQAEPDDEVCRYCDFLRVCGSSRARLHELKADDPARRPFVELRAIE